MSKESGIALIVIGILLFFVGMGVTIFTFGLGIICAWPLLILGPILFLVGLILLATSSTPHGIIQQPPQYQPQQKADRYCPACGRAIPFDARNCPYCDKKFT